MMVNFASDNVTGACPEVLQAVLDANDAGPFMPYGNDPLTTKVEQRLRETFESDLVALPLATGTACNALALAAIAPPWGAIYCHRMAHVNVHECGAPEFYSGGAKLVALDGEDGKLTPETLAAAIHGAGNVHEVQPAAVSLTQATETGTLYTPAELAALCSLAHRHGLRVHLDGARFANAVAALGCSPAEITWKAGVDVLSFGATKNGALAAEALLFFDPALAVNAGFQRKRAGHLFSKMRFIAAQLIGYLDNEVWLRNARHANDMAGRLAAGLQGLPGVELIYPVESNQVFARLPTATSRALLDEGHQFYFGAVSDEGVRLVTAWNTGEDEVEAFLAACARHLPGEAAAQ